MDVTTARSDVLAQPTRARLFSLLADRALPSTTEELAAALDLHVNGVRGHLERLREAGLVDRARERRGRGRPRDVWTIRADAQPGGEPPSGYVELGRWLARALSEGGTVEATGREIGRELARGQEAAAPEAVLHGRFVALGFQPERRVGPGATLTYELANCPYREAVNEGQAVVCGLHRGLTRGLLDVLSPESELVGFVPKDPHTAGCLIEIRGLPAERPDA